MSFDWKSMVGQFAPLISTAIGGPIGGIAMAAVTKALDLPKDASEKQIAQAAANATPEQILALKKADNDFKTTMKELDLKEEDLFNTRVESLEGTANDLKALPIIGPVVIFMRGCQRPAWGFGTMFMDYKVFGNQWHLINGSSQDTAFLIINLLVLGFFVWRTCN